MPEPLPLPVRVHPLLAAGRDAVLADRGAFVTVGGSGCEFPGLREALARPPDGRRRICLMDAVHRETGIEITGTVEIYGFGAGRTILEAAEHPEEASDRVFSVAPGGRLFLSGITVRGGRAQDRLRNGGGIANYGSLVIEDCALVENHASSGAGIWTAGQLELRRSLVAGNRTVPRPAAEEAAGIGCRGSGAGIKVDKPGSARIEDCLIAWNSSIRGGGGLHVSCETSISLENCTIFGNSAETRGGGIDLAGGSLVMDRCTIAGNTASGQGFAVYNRGRLSIAGCLLASEIGTAYFRAVNSGGEFGEGSLVLNTGNFCQSGNLPDAVTGDPGPLEPADHGGPVWIAAPDASSPARGFGARP